MAPCPLVSSFRPLLVCIWFSPSFQATAGFSRLLSPDSHRMPSLSSTLQRTAASTAPADNWLVLVCLTPFVAICAPRCPARLGIPFPEAHGVYLPINARHKQVGSSSWLHLSWSPGLCLPIIFPVLSRQPEYPHFWACSRAPPLTSSRSSL